MKPAALRTPILLAAAVLGCRLLAARGPDLWTGETRWLIDARHGRIGAPLYELALSAWRLVSEDAVWLRSLSFLFSAAAAILIYLLARRAFNHLGSLEAGILAAASPLLCSAAWEVHPCALETAAAALWLYAFLGLIQANRNTDMALHAAAAAAAVAVNPLMALFAPAQLAILAAGYRRLRPVMVRWLISLTVAAAVFAAVLLTAGGEPERGASPPRGLTGYDVGFLITDASLGGIFPWAPPTPALTFAPAGQEDPAIHGRTAGSLDSGFLPWFLQRMQLLVLGLFCMVGVMACLALWGISARGMPGGLRRRMIPRSARDAGRDAGGLLVMAVVFPVIWALAAGTGLGEPLPDRRLLFVTAPFLVLIGRGLTRLQFAPVRYGLLAIIVALSCFYSFSTVTLKEAAHGISAAVAPLRQEWRRGDALSAPPVFRGPAVWYGRLDQLEVPPSEATARRFWRLAFAPAEGSISAGLQGYLERCGFGGDIPSGGTGAMFEARFESLETQKWTAPPYVLELLVSGPGGGR